MKMEICLAAFAAFAASVLAVETNTYYTVTADGGTYSSPISLETLDVTVEKVGEEAVVKPFAEVWEEFAGGPAIFRKRGTGWMMSSTKMAAFTGEIRIEAGAFMVNTNLMTGPQVVATAPTVVISNGASFALAATSETCLGGGSTQGLRVYNHFHLNGNGVDNLGTIANILGINEQYCFNGDWTLDGDSLLCGVSSCRYDMVDKRTVTMNGHTLTMKKGVGSKWWNFCPGSSRFIDGHIIVDGMSFNPQSSWGSGWQTGAENTLILTNSSTLVYYNSNPTIPWTLIMEQGSLFSIGGGANSPSDYGHTSSGRWDGPLRANGAVRIVGNAANKGLVLKGPLSGPGPVTAGSGWLQLLADSPDYLGKLYILQKVGSYSVRDSGLGLYSANALNPAGEGVSFTNAVLRLATDDAYMLPPITAYVSSGTNYSFTGGNSGSMYSSLLKTGDGVLEIESPVSITGRLELAAGTLRMAPVARVPFYSLVGGLWKGALPQADTSSSHAYMYTAEAVTNDIASCCDLMKFPSYPPWQKFTSYSWCGYLWNRTETNETWRFALGVSGYSQFYIDGSKIMSSDNNARVYFYNKTMKPGPHPFLFKVNSRNYGHPGSISVPPSLDKDWTNGALGLAVSKTSTTSTNSDDFVFMENSVTTFGYPGGDGYWFTRDDRDVTDFSADDLMLASASRRTCSNVVCRAGTLLDLGEGNEMPLITPRFEGVTTVTNGGVRIREAWRLRDGDFSAPDACLAVHGELKFDDGAEMEWEGLSHLPRAEYVIARATGGIDGMPKWAPTDKASSRWRLTKEVDGDGNDILRFRWHAGSVVSFR